MPYDESGNYIPLGATQESQQFSEDDQEIAMFLEEYVPHYVADYVYETEGVALAPDQAYALGEEMIRNLDEEGIAELIGDIGEAYQFTNPFLSRILKKPKSEIFDTMEKLMARGVVSQGAQTLRPGFIGRGVRAVKEGATSVGRRVKRGYEKAGKMWKEAPTWQKSLAIGVPVTATAGGVYVATRKPEKRKMSEGYDTSPMARRRTAQRRLEQLGYQTENGYFFQG